MLYGAIIGDIVGSRFEHFDYKKKDFTFFAPEDRYTDDTVMTIAIYEACKEIKANNYTNQKQIESCFAKYMIEWGYQYPGAGYGGKFCEWIFSEDHEPYNSWGNGSAMRVSSVGWIFNTLEEVERMAEYSANPTHNHPEGIKGAKAVAVAIYLARTEHSKHKIKKYIKSLGYKLRRCNSVRPKYKFDASCQGTIPVAIEAFLESKNFEDAIRLAISMGGDSDTIGAITGSIAEAYYGIPIAFISKCNKYLDDTMLEHLDSVQWFVN